MAATSKTYAHCRVSAAEAGLLSSPQSPIVLLAGILNFPTLLPMSARPEISGHDAPYTPLHHLLLRETGLPL